MRKMEKGASILLSFALLFTSNAFCYTKETNADAASMTVNVTSFEELVDVQQQLNGFVSEVVNENGSVDGATFTINLQSDIKADGNSWEGICVNKVKYKANVADSRKGLNIIFNGNGHSIIGLKNNDFESNTSNNINNALYSGTASSLGNGLFGIVKYANLTVNKVTVAGADLQTRINTTKKTLTNDWHAAGIVEFAYASSITVSNCTVKDSVFAGISSAAGIVAYTESVDNEKIIIKNCKVTNCTIKGGSNTGGIAGYVKCGLDKKGSISSCSTDNKTTIDCSGNKLNSLYEQIGFNPKKDKAILSFSTFKPNAMNAGGIIGRPTNINISDSTNRAVLNYGDNDLTGGDIGGISGSLEQSGYIRNCENFGKISGGGIYVGGIVGYIPEVINEEDDKSIYFSIVANTNSGDISGKSSIGGNIGGVEGIAEMENLTNKGNVYGSEEYIGGNIGILTSGNNVLTIDNQGDVEGAGEYIGGNIGFVETSCTVEKADNEGNLKGVNYVGGNVGENCGTLRLLSNTGSISGENYIGGNLGFNSKKASVKAISNMGKVSGTENIGGNAGASNGEIIANINTADISGEKNIGGNIGYNQSDGFSRDAINSGNVSGKYDMDVFVGKDEGRIRNYIILGRDSLGTMIAGPLNDKYPSMSNDVGSVIRFKTGINKKDRGAIYYKGLKNGKIEFLAVPKVGYKFAKWEADSGITPRDSSNSTEQFTYKELGYTKAVFEEAKNGDILVEATGSEMSATEKSLTMVGGLKLVLSPAAGGRIKYIASAENSISITVENKSGYVFEKWEVSGGASLYKGSSLSSETATFSFTPGKDSIIKAVFKKIPNDGPVKNTIVKDKKYNYKVLVPGSKNGKIYGKLAVEGFKKKSLKTIKIAKTVKIDGVNYKVTVVSANAFKGNKIVSKVFIGKNITSIGANSFAGMKNLKDVAINSTKLKKIGVKAFYGDKKLSKVIIKSSKLKNIGKNAFNRKKGVKLTFAVPKKKKKAYKKLIKKAKTNKYKVK